MFGSLCYIYCAAATFGWVRAVMSATVRLKEADMVSAAGNSLAVQSEAAGPPRAGKILARPPHVDESRSKACPQY